MKYHNPFTAIAYLAPYILMPNGKYLHESNYPENHVHLIRTRSHSGMVYNSGRFTIDLRSVSELEVHSNRISGFTTLGVNFNIKLDSETLEEFKAWGLEKEYLGE